MKKDTLIQSKLVSTCSSKDLSVWQISSAHIVDEIDCNSYTLIVPNDEVSLFTKKSPSEFKVLSEEMFLSNLKKKLCARVVESSNLSGWYMQQFAKLAFLHSERYNEGMTIIWDADTVPLKKILFTEDAKIKFYLGSEHHQPYFSTINKLLGLEKIITGSFISQCMPVPNRWSLDFFNYLESTKQKYWIDAILDAIDFRAFSAFSEYETLGTFFYSKFSEQMLLEDQKFWQRRGNGLIGSAENIKHISWILKLKYDYIAFEKWDKSFSFYQDLLRLAYKKNKPWTKN